MTNSAPVVDGSFVVPAVPASSSVLGEKDDEGDHDDRADGVDNGALVYQGRLPVVRVMISSPAARFAPVTVGGCDVVAPLSALLKHRVDDTP